MSKHIFLFFCACFLIHVLPVQAQTHTAPNPAFCGTSEAMQAYYDAHPDAKKENEAFAANSSQFTTGNSAAKTTKAKYTIPVVFHVYGTTQGGYPINDALIKLAIKGVNDDFNGLNADYNSVHNQYKPVRAKLDINLALAQKDPLGNPTTGILYYPVKSGYARATASNADVAADAWDNYKYMNIYVMVDLYADGILNNSGVAWYPDIAMTNANLARIVYNGTYLATNNTANPEFASVLTHECGHFFNLIHTFEGGCTAPNDNVADTPPCTTAQGCHATASANAPLNCNNVLLNAENYMDYNTNCYRMFTQGQVARMETAMNHPARVTLWQDTNLVKTGVVGVQELKNDLQVYSIYPNPSGGKFTFHLNANTREDLTITVNDILGRTVYTAEQLARTGDNRYDIDISGKQSGLYFLTVQTATAQKICKIRLR